MKSLESASQPIPSEISAQSPSLRKVPPFEMPLDLSVDSREVIGEDSQLGYRVEFNPSKSRLYVTVSDEAHSNYFFFSGKPDLKKSWENKVEVALREIRE